jgi:hypothetical protein
VRLCAFLLHASLTVHTSTAAQHLGAELSVSQHHSTTVRMLAAYFTMSVSTPTECWILIMQNRSIGIFLRKFPHLLERVDVVALLDEWAARFFEELDYIREGNNGTRFAASMAKDLPQVRAMHGLPVHRAVILFKPTRKARGGRNLDGSLHTLFALQPDIWVAGGTFGVRTCCSKFTICWPSPLRWLCRRRTTS